MNKVKRSGPKWLPCGTPDVIRKIQDKEFLKRLVVSCHSDSLKSNLEDQQGNLKDQVFLLEGND